MAATRKPANRRGAPTPSETKDAFFVQVAGDAGVPQFFNTTDKVGRPMPFQRPIATVAMRATGTTVAFSLLTISNRARSRLRDLPVAMPDGPLARLQRKARNHHQLPTNQLVADIDGQIYTLTLERDEAGCVTVALPGSETSELDDDGPTFDIPKGGPKVTLFLTSPVVPRVIAVSSMGARYPGKPGSLESVERAASMVLFNLSQLLEFRLLSGIETVDVPAAPTSFKTESAAGSTVDPKTLDVSRNIPVWLFDGNPPQPIAAGQVQVTVDLHTANPATGRLLLRHTPSAELGAHFERYRQQFDAAASHLLTSYIGDVDLADMTYSVVIGELDEGAVERLNEALDKIATGIDLAVDRYRVHGG